MDMLKTLMLRTITFLFLAQAMILLAQGQIITSKTPITAEAVNALGGDRYAAVEPVQVVDWSIFGDQQQKLFADIDIKDEDTNKINIKIQTAI